MKSRNTTLVVTLATALLAACPDPEPEPPAPTIDESIFAEELGGPENGASDDERATFERGRLVASRRFTTMDGLGPHYNVSFCGACHEQPELGGSSPRYRDFNLVGTRLDDGSYIPLGVNGVQTQFTLDAPYRVPTPTQANHSAARNAIPFFGVGALAALEEDAILEHADPDDADGDGISGRPNYDRGFVGRFGRKAQTVSIEGFIRGPLFNHMGVTSIPLSEAQKAALPVPSQSANFVGNFALTTCITCQAAAPDEPTVDDDGVPDPELSQNDLFDLVSFAMLMGAPLPDEATDLTREGEARFADVNCTGCHVPALRGKNGLIPAYSDLLLHDMGDELADGIEMGVATGNEFRTQPLWGVGAVGPYLHDGRADTLHDAIAMHAGEAEASRDAYLALSEDEQAAVIAFLESLGGSAQRSAGLLPPQTPVPAPGELGGPSRALNAEEMARFERGRAEFDRDHDAREGLGLGGRFNGDSCRACHFEPTIGGAGAIGLNVTRQGSFDPVTMTYVTPADGNILHRFRTDRQRPSMASDVTFFELRQTPPLFGLGLLEGISDETLLAAEDPEDADQDGISGRAHIIADGRIGRFGWKAVFPTLEDFVRDALSNELGLTLNDGENYVAGVAGDDDDIADPEFGGEPYADLVFYSSLLGPPPARPFEGPGADAFAAAGCDACHTPALPNAETGDNVLLYSDLLLHDVSPEGYVGIVEGNAEMGEYRTPPLWGVGQTAPYMHDGFAPTLHAAILRHAGEANASREAYLALSEAEREALLSFLRSL